MDIYNVNTIRQTDAKKQLDSNKDIILIDVRTPEEFEQSHVENSINIPMNTILYEIENQIKNKEQLIFLICRTGRRTKTSAILMQSKGYTNVYDIGGVETWEYGLIN